MALFGGKEAPPPTRPEAPKPGETGRSAVSFIGQNVTFDGTLTGTESVVIEGNVRGKINLQADLRIGLKARIEAEVHAKNVTIEGTIVGNASADNRLELMQSANVEGNIKAPKVIVAEGAKFRGAVDMGSQRPKDASAPGDHKEKEREK